MDRFRLGASGGMHDDAHNLEVTLTNLEVFLLDALGF